MILDGKVPLWLEKPGTATKTPERHSNSRKLDVGQGKTCKCRSCPFF